MTSHDLICRSCEPESVKNILCECLALRERLHNMEEMFSSGLNEVSRVELLNIWNFIREESGRSSSIK